MSDPAWWLLGEGQVLAGPFATRADVDRAGPPPGETWEDVEDVAAVYGTRLADGSIEQHPCPNEIAWRRHLADQLSRLSDAERLPLSERTPHADLARCVATRLVEAGFDLHDCAGRSGDPARVGVCLTPTRSGVMVSWTQYDRAAVEQEHRYEAHQNVQRLLNAALYEVLGELGFEVQPFGQHALPLVVAERELCPAR